MGYRLFLSHSVSDEPIFGIREIAELLESKPDIDKAVFCEEDCLDNFVGFMSDNLGATDVFIIFCSPTSAKSKWVKEEWTAAVAMHIPVIPVYSKMEHIPPLLAKNLGVEFRPFDTEGIADEIYEYFIKKRPAQPKGVNLDDSRDLSNSNPIIQTSSARFDFFDTEIEKMRNSNNIEGSLKIANDALAAATKSLNSERTEKYRNLINELTPTIYHGTPLDRPDYEFMIELEKIMNESIPKSVSRHDFGYQVTLKKIKLLTIGQRNLEYLPENIGNLQSLEYLDISLNNLEYLPASIGDLLNLEHITVAHNKLVNLPESITNLKKLKYASFSYNNFTEISENIKNWLIKLKDNGCKVVKIKKLLGM